jgi:hydroxypyruvate reductase
MAEATLSELRGAAVHGLLVPPEPDAAALAPLEVVAGGHPLPSAGSLRAGARALELCRSADADTFVLFLLSGGGSSLCELPLDPSMTLDELRALYRALLGSGAPIGAVNTVRKSLSAVKGGRLAGAAANALGQCTFAVLDVPGADLAALASGPTLGDDAGPDARASALAHTGAWRALSDTLRRRLLAGELPPPLRTDDPRLRRGEAVRLLDNDRAVAALAHRVEAAGLRVCIERGADELPCEAAAQHLLARLRLEAQRGPRPVAIVAGGEVTVVLPEQPGRGGRNQQWALACALRIVDQPIAVLSGGTDGVDGDSGAAGAVADGTTVGRARAMGLDAEEHLRRCDAAPLFAALGDALVTGPTGTNVRDLRLLVHG